MVATAEALEMSPDQRAELESMAKSHTLAHRQVRQSRALLLAGDGVANEEIARRSEASTKTVRRWRSRFAAEGIAGVVRIRAGRGRPPQIPDAMIETIVNDTLHTLPRTGRRTGRHAPSPTGSESARTPLLGSGGHGTSNRGWSTRSNSQPIRSSRRNSSTLLACIATRPNTPLSSAPTRNPRSKPSNAPNRRYR